MLKRTNFTFTPELDEIAYFKKSMSGKRKHQAPETYSTESHSGSILEHIK